MSLHAGLQAWVRARDDVQLVALGRQPSHTLPAVFLQISGGNQDPAGTLLDWDLHVVLASRDLPDVSAAAETLAVSLADGLRASSLPVAVSNISGLAGWDDPNPRAETGGWWAFTISTETLTAYQHTDVPTPAGDPDMTRTDTLLDAGRLIAGGAVANPLPALAWPDGTSSLADFDRVAVIVSPSTSDGATVLRDDCLFHAPELTAADGPARQEFGMKFPFKQGTIDLIFTVDFAGDGTYALVPGVVPALTSCNLDMTVIGFRDGIAPA